MAFYPRRAAKERKAKPSAGERESSLPPVLMPSLSNIRRENLWTAAVLLISSIIILGSAPAQYLGRQQDDLMYALAAQSLAYGQGFRLITSPGLPWMNVVSPGLPVFLFPIAYFFPGHFGLFELFCAFILSLCPWAFWLWLKKRKAAFPADILLVLIFSSSPIILSQSGTVMSESLFVLMTLLFLISMESLSSSVRTWAGGLSLMALIQTRLAGAFLIPAAFSRCLRERKGKEFLGILTLSLFPLAIWMYYSLRFSGQIQKVKEGLDFYGVGLPAVFTVFLKNAAYYSMSLGFSFLPLRTPPAAGEMVGGVLFFAVLWGLWIWIKKDLFDPAAWALISTLVLHLFWPWHYDRYLMMPLPLILLALHDGIKRLAVFVLPALLFAQMVFYLPHFLSFSGDIKQMELKESYAWLRAHTNPQDILSSAMYVRDGFYSARPSLPLALKPSAKSLNQFFENHQVRYVLWEGNLDLGLSVPGKSPINSTLQKIDQELQNSRFFKLVYENRRENSAIYKVR